MKTSPAKHGDKWTLHDLNILWAIRMRTHNPDGDWAAMRAATGHGIKACYNALYRCYRCDSGTGKVYWDSPPFSDVVYIHYAEKNFSAFEDKVLKEHDCPEIRLIYLLNRPLEEIQKRKKFLKSYGRKPFFPELE